MGEPLGAEGSALCWREISGLHVPRRSPKECQVQWSNLDDPRLRLFWARPTP